MYEKHQATLTCQFCDYHVFDHENESEILSGQHLAKHREKQFWFCAICSEQFKTEREVRTHWSSHESISTNFCRECDMLMPSETCLRLHRSYWHPEKLVQASSGNRIVFEFSEVGTETARKLVGPDRRVSFLPDPSLETSSMDPLTITPASKSRPTGFPTLSLNGASSNAEFIAAAVPAIVPKTEVSDILSTTFNDDLR